jgi:hypothetical protein
MIDRMTTEITVTRKQQERIGRMTIETTVNVGKQDQAATDAVEDWDQRQTCLFMRKYKADVMR